MTTSNKSKTASPTACATSCGAIIRRCAPSAKTSPATGSSICGTRCRHRMRRRAPPTRRSGASSRATAFAAETAPGQICEQRDVAILRSYPGLGRINVATLLAEACEPLHRRDYHALRTLSGVAPVTQRSGKSCVVIPRHACNPRLQTAAYHWARVAIQHDPISRQRYAALRARGHNHARALRSVADRLLYVLCTLLERQDLFDPSYAGAPATAAA